MSFEVEIKYQIAEIDELEAALKSHGVIFGLPFEEMDQFYQHPNRDFRKTDEGLRIRRRFVADRADEFFVTYKGPKIDQLTKTRREIEMPLVEPDLWNQMLLALGFLPAGFVHKFRRHSHLTYSGISISILLDELPFLREKGMPHQFVEIETIAEEADLEVARTILIDFAALLNLTDPVRTGYLNMLEAIS
ncbi:MAG: class IV adenylate cyclase [Thermoguttaceae bacterium]